MASICSRTLGEFPAAACRGALSANLLHLRLGTAAGLRNSRWAPPHSPHFDFILRAILNVLYICSIDPRSTCLITLKAF